MTVQFMDPQGNSIPVASISILQLLALPDEDLENFDLVRLNLAVARGIPGLHSLDVEKYVSIVEDWEKIFRRDLPRMEKSFRRTPWKWKERISGQGTDIGTRARFRTGIETGRVFFVRIALLSNRIWGSRKKGQPGNRVGVPKSHFVLDPPLHAAALAARTFSNLGAAVGGSRAC